MLHTMWKNEESSKPLAIHPPTYFARNYKQNVSSNIFLNTVTQRAVMLEKFAAKKVDIRIIVYMMFLQIFFFVFTRCS